jgi:hypothetical protein
MPGDASFNILLPRNRSIGCEETRRFLRVVATAVVEFGRAGLAMACGALHIIERRTVLQGCRDEGSPHRMRRKPARQTYSLGMLAQYPVYGVGVHMPATILALAVMTKRPKHRPIEVFAATGCIKIRADALCGVWMNGKRVAPPALAHDTEAIEAAILVEIFDRENGNLGTAEAYLQSYGENRPVPQSFDCVFGRRI